MINFIPPKVLFMAAAVAVCIAGLTWIYMAGRSDGYDAAMMKVAEKTAALNDRIAELESEASQSERMRLTEIQALNTELAKLRRNAHADPNASRRALGAASVQRLNSIRAGESQSD